MQELIEASFDYVQQGFVVIALSGKLPNGLVHKHWKESALDYSTLSDVKTAGKFIDAFGHPATTGIGLLTGVGGRYVVDIDGEEGARAWRELVGDDDFMPDRWVAKTGRGLHLWVGSPYLPEWPTTKLAEKLDFKGLGGYVAAPPSRHPDGHLYEWLLPPTEAVLLEMPEPLTVFLQDRRAEREAAIAGKQMRRQVPVSERDPNLIYADVSFEGVIDTVRNAPEGNRNNILYWAAMTLYEDGATDEDFATLKEAALNSGLTRLEVTRTLRSAMDDARG